MIKIMSSRRKKFPLKIPNCGSVFKSNPSFYESVGPPGFAIEQVGLKGARVGGARISPYHANFIINDNNASSSDILSLINLMGNCVYDRYGLRMEAEVLYVAKDGTIQSPFLL